MSVIVCDAGPIIHLYEARCLPLLRQTGSLFVPHRVYVEVQTAIVMDTQWPDWLQVVKLSSKEQNEASVWQAAGGLHEISNTAVNLQGNSANVTQTVTQKGSQGQNPKNKIVKKD